MWNKIDKQLSSCVTLSHMKPVVHSDQLSKGVFVGSAGIKYQILMGVVRHLL